MNSSKNEIKKSPGKRGNILLRLLGPGLVTGAADDDPSGIATYSQAGAQFGYGLLWTVFLTTPFMIAIQLVSAQIGRVTGKGIVANVKDFAPRWVVISLVSLLVMANTFNIAADLAAMGEALSLVIGGLDREHALIFAAISVLLQVFVRYRRYAPALKFLTLVLFLYVALPSPSTFRGAKRSRALFGRLPRLTAIICSWSSRCSGRPSVPTSSSGKHPRRSSR